VEQCDKGGKDELEGVQRRKKLVKLQGLFQKKQEIMIRDEFGGKA